MIINHNLSSINAHRDNNISNGNVADNVSKLSSGLRINRASDDAAGLAISEKMRSQIRGLNRASKNALDGVSFIQTTEGWLEETTNILQRIRELAVQSSNGVNTDQDRMQIQVEVSQLVDEVDRIASQAQFNELNMLTGRFAQNTGQNQSVSMVIHMGANTDQREQMYIGTMTTLALGLRDVGTQQVMSLETSESSNRNIGVLDNALQIVTKQRADLGAYQNRLESAIRGLDIGAENLQAAESRIRDLDMAKETVSFTKNQILSQSSMAMLAQANQLPQQVLQLLR